MAISKLKFLQIRISEEEKIALKKIADDSGQTMTELITKAIHRIRPFKVKDRKIQKEKILHLARIGNNLNQIARWCNTHKSGADAIQVIQQLTAIEHELKKAMT